LASDAEARIATVGSVASRYAATATATAAIAS
jgi:hypothetical protein